MVACAPLSLTRTSHRRIARLTSRLLQTKQSNFSRSHEYTIHGDACYRNSND